MTASKRTTMTRPLILLAVVVAITGIFGVWMLNNATTGELGTRSPAPSAATPEEVDGRYCVCEYAVKDVASGPSPFPNGKICPVRPVNQQCEDFTYEFTRVTDLEDCRDLNNTFARGYTMDGTATRGNLKRCEIEAVADGAPAPPS